MSRIAAYNPSDKEATVRALVSGQADFIEITTPDSGGSELEVKHGLGRIPKGIAIVKRTWTGVGPLEWGAGSTTWTRDAIYLKFSETNTAYTIAVF